MNPYHHLEKNCPSCQSILVQGFCDWHFVCHECHYEQSRLTPKINHKISHQSINETIREDALKQLRTLNFKKLLVILKEAMPSGGNLLEVGCAHGWFLDLAAKKFSVLGLEPDEYIYNLGAKQHGNIRKGYFPAALSNQEKFDVIVFNDVFEHLSDPIQTINACRMHLNENGLLLLNLPSSGGVFYRLSKIIYQLGYKSFFYRLWQKDLPSPHLHYFNSSNLTELLIHNGFNIEHKGYLNTLHLSGLYSRISYTQNNNALISIVIFIMTICLMPLLYLLPRDIIYMIAKKND